MSFLLLTKSGFQVATFCGDSMVRLLDECMHLILAFNLQQPDFVENLRLGCWVNACFQSISYALLQPDHSYCFTSRMGFTVKRTLKIAFNIWFPRAILQIQVLVYSEFGSLTTAVIFLTGTILVFILNKFDSESCCLGVESTILSCRLLTVLQYVYRYWTIQGIEWARDFPRRRYVDGTSMVFRLLRLHGFSVTTEAFGHFKQEGRFL